MAYDIISENTALLIIDAQREYFDEGGALYTEHAAEIKDHLLRLRDAAANAGICTVLIRHVHKADGSDVGRMGDFDDTPVFVEGTPGVELVPELGPRRGDIVIDKTRYSAFVNTNLESTLKEHGIDTLIITGLMSNYCSETTARHAHDLDYRVIFVEDANAGPDMPDLGHGPIPHAELMRVISTSLSGGVADVVRTKDLLMRIG